MARTSLWPTLALLLALSVCPALAGHSRRLLQNQQATLSGRAILLAQNNKDRPSNRMFAVRTLSGRQVQVHYGYASQIAGIRTGMSVEVTGQWQHAAAPGASGSVQAAAAGGSSSGGRATFKAATIHASDAPFAAPRVVTTTTTVAADAAASGRVSAAAAGGVQAAAAITLSSNTVITPDVNTLIIPISSVSAPGTACPGTSLPKLSVDELKKVVFAELNPTGATVGKVYSQCSHGKSKLNTANSAVADIVNLPCSGNTNGVDWTFSKCDFEDFNGWAEAAEAKLLADNFPLNKYKYRVYMLPPGACGFVGLGYVGCDGTPGLECRAWINGDYWGAPAAIIHEVGHNLFMEHAGALNGAGAFDSYGDTSCSMGYCCANRCFNTPHAWQMGWITMQQLDGASLAPGQTVVVAGMASQSTAARSGVRIVPSWAAGVDPVFLGFRTRARGDANLGADVAGKLSIHTSPMTNTYDAAATTWRASLAAGQSWEHPTAGIVVRVKGFPAGKASFTVCRKGGAETAATCAAGIDNDCNGLVGAKDPACVKLRRTVKPKAMPK